MSENSETPPEGSYRYFCDECEETFYQTELTECKECGLEFCEKCFKEHTCLVSTGKLLKEIQKLEAQLKEGYITRKEFEDFKKEVEEKV